MFRTIPTIGGAGQIFEVFVPGLFLLLNFLLVTYFFPFFPSEIKQSMVKLLNNPVVSLIIAIGFGYLMGVILRIFRAEFPDKLSGWFLQKFDKKCRKEANEKNLYAHLQFPYIGWLGVVCKRALPNEVLEFYYDKWAHFEITQNTLKALKEKYLDDAIFIDVILGKIATLEDNSFTIVSSPGGAEKK